MMYGKGATEDIRGAFFVHTSKVPGSRRSEHEREKQMPKTSFKEMITFEERGREDVRCNGNEKEKYLPRRI